VMSMRPLGRTARHDGRGRMHFVVVCLHCWWVDMLLVRLLDGIGRCLVFALYVFASYMPGKVPTLPIY